MLDPDSILRQQIGYILALSAAPPEGNHKENGHSWNRRFSALGDARH
jgi:hypothetical protein